MTELARLAARTLLASFDGVTVPLWARRRLADGLGGVCLYGENARDPETVASLTTAIHEVSPTAVTAIDEEGGDVTRLHYVHGSPHAGHAVLGAVDKLELTAEVASDIGAELLAAGVDLDLGPVADVNSNPLNPVIGVRSFGADPELVARHTVAWVRGVQGAGAGACLKHFPGHGDTVADSHLALPVVDADVSVLEHRELVPFRAGVAAGAVAVMTSHVVVRALDPTQPATFSSAATRLLRAPVGSGGVGFQGLLVSDALDMAGASGVIGIPAAAVRALGAGVDLLCLGVSFTDESVQAVLDAIVAAVETGQLSHDRVAEAAGRVNDAADRMAGLRATARQSASAVRGRGSDASEAAADAAVSVRGTLPALAHAQVLRFVTTANLAVGHAPWGLPVDGVVLDGHPPVDVREGERPPSLDADRPVLLLVRDAPRHPWIRAAVAEIVAARPDAVVVDFGWPGSDPLPAGALVQTWGASSVSARALDRLLGPSR